MFDKLKIRRAARLREPLTATERAIVARNAPYVATLDDGNRAALEGLVRSFLADKPFEGCGGMEITDEVRVTVAAHACRLVLRHDGPLYAEVDTILVYPTAFLAPAEADEDGIVPDEREERVGESWTRGVVVLAWDEVCACASEPVGGQNVVIHEFAHQLDAEDGEMNGTPLLPTRAAYESWERTLGESFDELCRALEAGRRSDIDDYAATDRVEFFAVVSEMFFGKARSMKRRHPALYRELAAYYGQDPAAG